MSLHDAFAEARRRWAEDRRTTLCEVEIEGGAIAGVAEARLEPLIYRFAASQNLPVRVSFLAPERRWLLAERAFLLGAPDAGAETVSEARYGEAVEVYDRQGEFYRVATLRDRYLGWLPFTSLTHRLAEPSHRFAALRGHLHAGPRVSSTRLAQLSLGVELHVASEADGWAEVRFGKGAGFVRASLLEPLSSPYPAFSGAALCDFARRFLEVPYVWGGVSAWGLDCSGLVQTSFAGFGLALPRDSDQQERRGQAVPSEEATPGDLLFFPGHVAISLGGTRLIHANAHHMRVSVDDFGSSYGQRLAAKLTSVKRLEMPEPAKVLA